LNYFKDVETQNFTDEFEYKLSFWNYSAKMDLYLTERKINEEKYELPPQAPGNLFDVRFITNSFVSNLNETSLIQINAQQYPVLMKLDSDKETFISIELNDQSRIIKSGEIFTIEQPVNFIKIKKLGIPKEFVVYQNFPNPFNPKTEIQFFINKEGFVTVNIYDINGRLVQTLVNQKFEKGLHSVVFDGSEHSSGLYFYEIKTENQKSVKKMLLIK
jgi:hypothetical protein